MQIRLVYALLAIAFLANRAVSETDPVLAGYDSGLFKLSQDYKAIPLWMKGSVRKITRIDKGWIFLTDKGILFSADLQTFSERNAGFPVKTIKRFRDGTKAFAPELQEIKDLEVDPYNQDNLVVCTKDSVYVSTDIGLTWKTHPSPVPGIIGLKAVVIFSKPEKIIVVSHPIKGLWWKRFDDPKSGWVEFSKGLPTLGDTQVTNEIADIEAVEENGKTVLYAGHSFLSSVRKIVWGSPSFEEIWSGGNGNGIAESLEVRNGQVCFVSGKDPLLLDAKTRSVQPFSEAARTISVFSSIRTSQLNSVWFRDSSKSAWSLSELWLSSLFGKKPYREKAENRHGMYLVTDFMLKEKTTAQYVALMKERGLDSLVIDMKDDYGNLRFTPRSPILKAMGSVKRPLDVETFTSTMKNQGIYLIARIVVFKDEVVQTYAGGKYAVWDATTKAPWRGYLDYRRKVEAPTLSPANGKKEEPKYETVRENMKEYWVDPYCEYVWQYNVEIAKEIIARGFDEVQFDYIRFPTDGDNLGNAFFRYKDPGMDKDSALISFLAYARENIKAPISIDIYGANGFYRTGVRTGQDVEMLAKYVDVICPMFYPSHFEQSFLAQKPEQDRPYRIYSEGTWRNAVIARNSVVVRPYVQAFFYNVAYDQKYYDLDYVRREVEGVRDSANSGMTFWNNGGRYDDVPFLVFSRDNELTSVVTPDKKQSKK